MSPLTKKKTRTGDRRLPESWLGLLRDFYPLYPIHTGKDYASALESADCLIGRKLTSLQSRYVESLTLLIEEYESAHYPIDESWTPLEALKFLVVFSVDVVGVGDIDVATHSDLPFHSFT